METTNQMKVIVDINLSLPWYEQEATPEKAQPLFYFPP